MKVLCCLAARLWGANYFENIAPSAHIHRSPLGDFRPRGPNCLSPPDSPTVYSAAASFRDAVVDGTTSRLRQTRAC